MERHTPPAIEKGESSVHCFVCQQPGHYATQCPLRNGKGPAFNTIMAEVQQVTTRPQTKNSDWAAQDELRKTAQAWVEKANTANTERMRQESAKPIGAIRGRHKILGSHMASTGGLRNHTQNGNTFAISSAVPPGHRGAHNRQTWHKRLHQLYGNQ